MKPISRIATAAVVVGLGFPTIGCVHTDKHPHEGPIEARYNNVVDRCWPERYAYHARENVIAPFAIQATNGAILDQTVWTWMFEPNSAKLNPAGLEKLDYLARHRPHPDSRIFLQTSRDVNYDAGNPEKYSARRRELDEKRGQAILQYLAASNPGRSLNFEVQVIDPSDPSLSSNLASVATRGLPRQYRSTLTGGMGGGQGAGGGGAGGLAIQGAGGGSGGGGVGPLGQ